MLSINMIDFLKIKEKIKIIDLRSNEKYNMNHIPNSINIPSEKLLIDPERYLKKEEEYYLYCQKGITSYNICNILKKLGYRVININGGYESWIMKRN